jgi:prepilin-type N-terminal cleavage/methylation domain-containing protein
MKRNAFTLIELLVVISIIGLLSTIAVVSLGSARMNARNTQRKANLVQISKALELYYADYGVYPPTLVPPVTGVLSWFGNCINAGSYPDSGAGAWIPGFSSYMAQLPHDPNSGKGNPSSANTGCLTSPNSNCYYYRSNGIDYKLMSHCVPEGVMSATDPFLDPARATWAWQVSTPNASSW